MRRFLFLMLGVLLFGSVSVSTAAPTLDIVLPGNAPLSAVSSSYVLLTDTDGVFDDAVATFSFKGAAVGRANVSHQLGGLTGFDSLGESRSVRIDRSRFSFGHQASFWNQSFNDGCWNIRWWGPCEWSRDWTKDKNDSPCGSPATVPSPGAVVLASIGTVVVGWLRRRRSL